MVENPPGEALSCAVCGIDALMIVPMFGELPRVSSDCRPLPPGGRIGLCTNCGTMQKPADDAWKAEASLIYQRYDMFRQSSERAEQAVFDDKTGAPVRRSAVILKQLRQAHPLPQKDARSTSVAATVRRSAPCPICCRVGSFGHEISDATLTSLTGIPGFRHLYTSEVDDIQDSFDLIVLSQSLEHVIDPVATLATLRTKLTPKGVLLIQVPNARLNVFDLLVADHRSHFDPRTLAETARRAGFKHVAVSEWVYKELSMAVSDAPLEFSSLPEPPQMTRRISLSGSIG